MNVYLDEKEQLTEEEKELFLTDLKEVLGEYFECADRCTLDITRTKNGYSVCIIFDSARIKKFRKPR